MQLDPEVAYWAEMSEALAWADIYQSAAALPGDPVGAITARPGDGVAFAFTGLDIGFFNRVIGVGVARPAVESDVDEVVAFYDGAKRGGVGCSDRAARRCRRSSSAGSRLAASTAAGPG